MEENNPKSPAPEASKEKKSCSMGDYCWCKAIIAALIIVFTWWWTPSWANVAITVLAILIIVGAGGCCCKSKCKPKK